MGTRRLLIALLATLLCACGGGGGGYGSAAPAPAPPTAPPPAPTIIDIAQPWAKATPAEANMDEVMLGRAASDAAAIPRFRSLLVARHGKLVAENYFGGADSSTVFDLRSVTKSVVSMLTGIAVQTGKLPNIDATVGAYVDAPYALDAGDRAVTVRQLLTMSSRYQWNETNGDDYNLWVLSNDHVQFLLDRLQTDPAGVFTYNSAAVNLLGQVLQHAVAKPLPDFANDVLFQPIGITTVQWEELEPGMVNAGAGIKMTATDLLRFGQLLLQKGRTANREVVPESWIDAGTTPQFRLAQHIRRTARHDLWIPVVAGAAACHRRELRVGLWRPVRVRRSVTGSRRGRNDAMARNQHGDESNGFRGHGADDHRQRRSAGGSVDQAP